MLFYGKGQATAMREKGMVFPSEVIVESAVTRICGHQTRKVEMDLRDSRGSGLLCPDLVSLTVNMSIPEKMYR